MAFRCCGAFVIIALNSMENLSVCGSRILHVAPADANHAILYSGKSRYNADLILVVYYISAGQTSLLQVQ